MLHLSNLNLNGRSRCILVVQIYRLLVSGSGRPNNDLYPCVGVTPSVYPVDEEGFP